MVKTTLLCLSVAFSAVANAQLGTPKNLHWAIYFSGSKVGESFYKCGPDGGFSGGTTLAIGSAKINSKISGKFKNGILVEDAMDLLQAGKQVHSTLKDGKAEFIVDKAPPKSIPYDAKLTTYSGNLIPQFTESVLSKADFSKKQSQTIHAYLVDAGAALDLKITPKMERTMSLGTIRFYHAELGPTAVDYAITQDGRVVGMDVPGQKLRMIADGWDSVYVDPFAKYPELSKATYPVIKLPVQHMKTRDGVDLVQDVFVPANSGKFPVVFVRTPYDRTTESLNADFYVKRGYAYVTQDCRGMNDSGGEWDPFVHESEDGYDAIDWISKQSWCDGNVGMIGGSYVGYVQWAAAVTAPPALKCIVPEVSPPLDAMHNLPYDFGIFFLYGDIWWAKVVLHKKPDMSSVLSTLPKPDGFKALPLAKTMKAVLGAESPFYEKWLERTTLGDWKGWNMYGNLANVKIPVLHISGWWDGDEIGTNMNWAGLRALGRTNQWLIYGPWTHFFNSTSSLGDTDYGTKAMIDLDTLYIRWFDTWLKHKDVGLDKVPRVQAFVTGINNWYKVSDWPSPSSVEKSLFLSSKTSALGLKSDGELLDQPASHQAPSQYSYDPSDAKIPDRVKNVDPSKASTDVTAALKEKGVLVFRSKPLDRPMAISGPYDVELHFSTSAKDTDFYVSMCDIDEKGKVRAFGQSGKIRGSYIGGFDKVRPLVPDRTYVAHLTPWDVAHELKAGHRLGLFLSSSGFPIYARNLGTAEPIKYATKMIVQRNKIFHDSVHPSRLRFRVLW